MMRLAWVGETLVLCHSPTDHHENSVTAWILGSLVIRVLARPADCTRLRWEIAGRFGGTIFQFPPLRLRDLCRLLKEFWSADNTYLVCGNAELLP